MSNKNTIPSISEKIRNIREDKGYSQEYMAEMLKVSQQTYSLIEKKPLKTNLDRIQKIAAILEVKISFLLNEEDSFMQYNYHQNGGNAASYIQHVSDGEAQKTITQQMQNEINFLRKVLEKNLKSIQQ